MEEVGAAVAPEALERGFSGFFLKSLNMACLFFALNVDRL